METVKAFLTKWRYKNGNDDKQIGYMKLDGKNEKYIKGIECNHEQYISDIEAGRKQKLPQAYLSMMVIAFNRHINKFNYLDLEPSKMLWEYQASPLMVQVKEEVLSDGDQDANKDDELNHAKETEVLNMEARDKGTSSSSDKGKSIINLVHSWHSKLNRE
ncbi:hypothetical protein R1flu_007336 [Riccia fluitans]|uniref:Replication protein n=1 Tax=Riccia fluitans TaxID=41844 RepID=A0ABD1Z2P8_9MARC